MELRYNLYDTWNIFRSSKVIQAHIAKNGYTSKESVQYLVVQKILKILRYIQKNSKKVVVNCVIIFTPIVLVAYYLFGVFSFNTASAINLVGSCLIFPIVVIIAVLNSFLILIMFEFVLLIVVLVMFVLTMMFYIFKLNILQRIHPSRCELTESTIVLQKAHAKKASYDILSSLDSRGNKYLFIMVEGYVHYIVIPERYIVIQS